MSKREEYELKPAAHGAPIFWKSLEDKAAPEAAKSRAKAEFPRATRTRAPGRASPSPL